jgi:hypothetical protein
MSTIRFPDRAESNLGGHVIKKDRSTVESDAQRVPELLCRFRKQPEPVVVLQRGAMALAQVAQATQPARIHELGKIYQHHRPLLPVDKLRHASLKPAKSP